MSIVSVGASSSIYGLFGILYLDLIQNWPLIQKPKRELFVLTLNVIFALGIGLLPMVDNFAHVGGFVTGILSGIIFMPKCYYSRRDKTVKIILVLVCGPILVGLLLWGLLEFYNMANPSELCPWCTYIDCYPITENWCEMFS